MRLLHLADLHLGKRLNGFDLLDDQQFLLEQVLELCEKEKVDAVLLAGDLYDTPLPPAGAVTLLDRFLTGLAARGVRVAGISGNHDSAERLCYGAALFEKSGVYLAGRFTGALPCAGLCDRFGPVRVALLPFVRAATVAHYLPDAPITDTGTAVAAALATLPPAPGVRTVLVAHQFVTAGARAPELSGSETGAVSVGTLDNIDAALFAGFEYVALGHIHRPQCVGGPAVRYAGSPLCYSLEECGAEKGCVLVELGEQGGADCTFIPLRPKRALRHLTGPLAALTNPAAVCDAEDYIWATLTDATPITDAMARLRAAYPNAMKLEYGAWSAAAAAPAVQAVRERSFGELFGAFFEQMQGRAMTEAEHRELELLYREAKGE